MREEDKRAYKPSIIKAHTNLACPEATSPGYSLDVFICAPLTLKALRKFFTGGANLR